MLPSPLPESNYYVVFTKVNSPSDPYASKTKLRSLSGTLSFLRRSILLQDLFCPASAPPGSGAAGDWASSKEGNIPSAQSAATAALC
jgi:hypothetical protein